MTTVAFMSDLHIDSNNFGEEELETLITLLKDQQVQHLHIAGDIANGFGKTSQNFSPTPMSPPSVLLAWEIMICWAYQKKP